MKHMFGTFIPSHVIPPSTLVYRAPVICGGLTRDITRAYYKAMPLPKDIMDELDSAADSTGEQALLSRIPLQSGDDRKNEYLSYRATGFPVKVAVELSGVTMNILRRWRRNDLAFKDLEDNKLDELQSTVANDILQLEFMRNFRMFMKKDAGVIHKSLFDPEGMTKEQKDYLKLIRKHYTPNDLLSLMKALEPEKHQARIEIRLSWGEENSTGIRVIDAESRELPVGQPD